MSPFRLFSLSALIALTAVSGIAQTSLGTIAGTVTDPTGAVVVGASVTAKNISGSDDRTVTTGANGEYRVESLTSSTYKVTVSKPGFSTQDINNITVPGSVVTSVNAQLKVGATTEVVTVNAGGGAMLQTDSTELSSTISTQRSASFQ